MVNLGLEPRSPHPHHPMRKDCDCVEAKFSADKCRVKLPCFVCSQTTHTLTSYCNRYAVMAFFRLTTTSFFYECNLPDDFALILPRGYLVLPQSPTCPSEDRLKRCIFYRFFPRSFSILKVMESVFLGLYYPSWSLLYGIIPCFIPHRYQLSTTVPVNRMPMAPVTTVSTANHQAHR